jgi:hypothetical protein
MIQLRSSCFFVLLFTIACATPPPTDGNDDSPPIRQNPTQAAAPVELSAERDGTRVVLTLRNRSDSPVGYNLCSSSLQRRTGTTWRVVPTGEMCTMEIRELNAGGSATFEKTLPANAGRGEYRYVTTIERAGEGVELASNTLTIP